MRNDFPDSIEHEDEDLIGFSEDLPWEPEEISEDEEEEDEEEEDEEI